MLKLMARAETQLEMMRRHVQRGRVLVRRQEDLLNRLQVAHSPLVAEAHEFLSQLHSWQADHLRHLASLEQEIEAGLRDSSGKLR